MFLILGRLEGGDNELGRISAQSWPEAERKFVKMIRDSGDPEDKDREVYIEFAVEIPGKFRVYADTFGEHERPGWEGGK